MLKRKLATIALLSALLLGALGLRAAQSGGEVVTSAQTTAADPVIPGINPPPPGP